MEILGHSQISVTLTPSHVAPDLARAATTRIGETLWTVIKALTWETMKPKRWSRLGESNPGPTHYECVALPTELRRRARGRRPRS